MWAIIWNTTLNKLQDSVPIDVIKNKEQSTKYWMKR